MTPSPWTDTMIARLKRLWMDGKTAAEIAQALGPNISRCAVLGKIHRLKLARDRPRTGPMVKTSRPAPKQPGPVRRLPSILTDALKSDCGPPERGQATILSVSRCDCRWPLGDPKAVGFTLCGRPVTRGAFCTSHAAMGYRPTRETPQSLEHLARLI